MIRSMLVGIALVGGAATGSAAQQPEDDSVLIRNVTVISAHLDRPQPHMDVRIEKGRIASVSPGDAREGDAREDLGREGGGRDELGRVIDGAGKFVIPGLIDSHVHLAHDALVNPEARDASADVAAALRRQTPRSFLYHGVTSVIDLDFAASKIDWSADSGPAPAIYHCGRGVRIAGGYGPAFVPARIAHKVFPNLVYEEQTRAHWPDALDPADYTVDAAVERVIAAGGRCLKTYVESGFGGVFNWPSPSAAMLRSLADAAHRHGLVLVVHANSAEAWRSAIDAGADVIAHGLWHWAGDRRDATVSDAARAAIDAAIRAGVAVQPTIRVLEGERASLTWDWGADARYERVLPGKAREYLDSTAGRWSRDALLDLYRRHNPYPDVSPVDLIDVSIRRATRSMLAVDRAGGTLLLGSDTPSQEGVGNPPGLNTFLELSSWARAGVRLDTLFRSATRENARAFRLEDEIGTVEPGKQADLLVLDENPLLDVEAYDAIAYVIVDGVVLTRESLIAP